MRPCFYRRQVAPNGGQPGGIWREVVTNRVPFGALWRAIRLCWNYLARSGANKVPLGDKWRHVARNLSGATYQWIPIGGLFAPKGEHLALIARCKWRDESFKHFEIFLPPHSNLVPLRATTSQLGGSLSHYTPLGTLLATLGATINWIAANWHQLVLAQWTPSII